MPAILLSQLFGSVGIFFTSFYVYYYYYTVETSIFNPIESMKTIEDVVQHLQKIARKRPTDDILDLIIESLDNAPISEDAVSRISQLHRKYGRDLGRDGFAINLVWSAIVHTQSNTTDTTKQY